jgi:hypothetical protein
MHIIIQTSIIFFIFTFSSIANSIPEEYFGKFGFKTCSWTERDKDGNSYCQSYAINTLAIKKRESNNNSAYVSIRLAGGRGGGCKYFATAKMINNELIASGTSQFSPPENKYCRVKVVVKDGVATAEKQSGSCDDSKFCSYGETLTNPSFKYIALGL